MACSYFLRKFRERSGDDLIAAYATSRQLVQCLIISKLIALRHSMDLWEQEKDNVDLNPFSSILQFSSFAQGVSNSGASKNILVDLLKQNYDFLPITTLREEAKSIIVKLVHETAPKSKVFIIAIDECDLFSTEETVILSSSGTPRDLLSIIVREIDELRTLLYSENILISDIYCGTKFVTESRDIIQSAVLKSITTQVHSYYGLDLLSFDQSWDMLSLVYNLPNNEKAELKKEIESIEEE
ncbi:predicted protein [Naegleria gruberi]|uniref:Predicted protein n=1 Tax=Naegleria gruberi TaxID=5762 RepID=D2V6P0_NAEGR|nr:uncharacterized protein NAEGRDRAFT_64509 [Naegleria gruberi]EFC47612.1 predicted protein [Naegleria gruberi]|eukprot:XP_002680356.1 predicted protein [Naegleria gruberi strain NEG-M]